MSTINSRKRFEILKRDNFQCAYCGRSGGDVVLRIDHIHPKCEGGSDDDSNLVTACADCNGGKGGIKLTEKKKADAAERVVATHPGLVGKCFVFFRTDGRVHYQGVVRAKISEESYLVQFFDWMAGDPSTMQIVALARMMSEPAMEKRAGTWMFFEDDEHLRFWLDHRYREPAEDEAAE